ncbi:MAG TPA: PH domain-containing protein [Marmoricola sp.]|nr:PH domain-containing protein [Marmoricola sp.]
MTLQADLPVHPGWRRLDRRMLLVHPVNELVRFLPLVIGVFFLGSSTDGTEWWHVLGVAVPIGLGVLRYLTTSFRIGDQQLELRRGLVSRNVLTTPLDRVRTVELTSTPIHRILGLARVQVGTGSASKSSEQHFVLDSLALEEARHLRVRLLHRADRAGTGAPAGTGEPPGTGDAAVAAGSGLREVAGDEVLMRLDPGWVRFAPLTTSGLVIALGSLAFLGQFADNAVNALAEQAALRERVHTLPLWATLLSGLVAAVVVISLLAILGYLLTNWGFALSRDRQGRSYHVRRGLLTTRETSIERDRVRGLEIHQPLALRLARGGHLAAIVTGLDRRSRGSTTVVPPAPERVVVGVGEVLLDRQGPFVVPLVPHGPRARRRRWQRALVVASVVPLLVTLGAAFLGWPWWLLAPAALAWPAAGWLAHDRYRRLGHALTGDYLVLQRDTFRGRRDALQRTGIIGWNIRQSFFQRRAGLVTLTATTAAGAQAYHAVDIPEEIAVALAAEAVPGLLAPFLHDQAQLPG